MLFRLLFLLVVAVVVLFMWTQVMLPAWQGKDFFPLFNTSKRKAKRELREVKDDAAEQKIRIETEELRTRVTLEKLDADQEIDKQLDDLIDKQEKRNG